ncbi:MAG: DUF3352 domain-containing protein [Chloroflexi bacterium]|nr:DUF3352 domain-containing protein [Chloroflexota bacterium]
MIVAMATLGCSVIPASTTPGQTGAAELAAPESWVFVSINLRPGPTQLLHANQLADVFTSQPGFEHAMEHLVEDSPIGSTDLLRESLPLLNGEVAMSASGQLDSDPHLLLTAQSSDPTRLLSLYRAPDKLPPGTPIRTGEGIYTLRSGLFGAAYKGWAVISDDISTLQNALDRLDGATSLSLAHERPFQSLVERLPTERAAYAYVDGGRLFDVFGQESTIARDSADLQPLRPAAGPRAVSATLTSDGVELHGEGMLAVAGDSAVAGEVDARAAFAQLPPDTLVAYGGTDPPGRLGGLTSVLNSSAGESFVAPEVASVLGAMVDQLGGSFAVGLSAGTLGEPNGAPSLYLVGAGSDQNDLAGIEALLPPKSVGQIEVDGRLLNQVTTAPAGTLSYGSIDNWLYLISGDPEPVVTAADVGGLEANARYQMVRSHLTSGGPDLFVDLEGARVALEERQAAEEVAMYEQADRPLFTPLRAFGGNTSRDRNGEEHSQALLIIR